MITSITQFSELARDAGSNTLPIGDVRVGAQSRTSAGAFAVLSSAARFVRIATDTPVKVTSTGGKTNLDEFFPAGVEYFSVSGGEILTIATV